MIRFSIDGTAEVQRRLDGVAGSMGNLSTRTAASSAQIANAMRMVPAQLGDIASQLAGGQSPLLILLQQGSQLRDSFGSVGGAVRGVASSLLSLVNPYTVTAAALGGLVFAYSEGAKEASAYSRAIIMSGNAAGTSANQLADMASEISKSVGTQANAAQVLAALTGSGQVSADNLQEFGRVAVSVQRDIGRSVDDTVKDFVELGKSPVQASLKLNEAYHYLTASTLAQIKALDEQGRADDASEKAQKAYATAFGERAAKMQSNLGLIERSWRSAKEVAASAWDAFLGVGRKTTPAQELEQVQADIARARKKPSSVYESPFGPDAELRGQLPKLEKRAAELQALIEKEKNDAQQAALDAQRNNAKIEWGQEMDKYLSMAERQKKEIARVTNLGQAAGAAPEAIKAAVDKIKQNYSALNNASLTQLENQRDLQKEVMAGQAADLETNYRLQLISQSTYIARKRDMQVKEIDLEIPILKKQAELAGGKEDQSARLKALGELDVMMQRRANIIKGSANADKEAQFERAKAVNSLVDGWDRAIAAEAEALSQEVALFGLSDQARQVAIAQIKLETDARKFIADQARDGRALTEQEIEDLKLKTEARKKSTAEMMNERAAIAGAQQLLQENRKFSADYIVDEQVRAQRILDIDSEKWRELIRNTLEGSEARQKLLEQFDQWYANRQMTPVLDRWKGVIDNMDSDFREGFRDMLTGEKGTFSSFAKSIGNSLKTSLADALYQTFIKKYVVQIMTGFAGTVSGPAVASALYGGTGVSGDPSAAGGASSPITLATAAANAYKALTGGLNGISDMISGGVQNAMTSLGYTPMASQGLATASGQALTPAASMVGRIGGMAAGYMMGSSLNNTISGQYQVGSGFQTIEKIGTAVASYFGPIPGAIAGAVSGVINRAFGMGDKEVTAQGIKGTLTGDAVSGSRYTSWHQDGGWFRSDKDGTDTKALTDAMVAQFTQGLSAIELASSGFASSLGVSADWIKDYSKTFDIAQTGDATKDAQAIADFFTGIGDELAKRLVPNLDTFAQSGETAAATLERLAGDFQATDQVAQLIGKTAAQVFGSIGIESAKAREQLVSLAGGASVLGQEASFYAQNFLTDAQRLVPVQQALDAAMASLGLSGIQTREQFKGVIDSLDLTTQAGASQFTAMMKLTEAFAQVHPAADAAADAVDQAAQALQGMKDSASALLGGVGDAFSALQRVVDREKTAVQASVTAQTAAVNELQGLSQALHGALDSYAVPGQAAADRASAQAQIRTALALAKAGGVLPDADTLKNALSTVTQDASAQFGSYTDYLRDLYQTKSDIAQLTGVTDSSLTVEEQSLNALQDQLTALDAIVANGQAQIDALNGQSSATLSLEQAIQALGTSILSAKANPIVAATPGINDTYQSLLGRAPDAAGLAYWQQVAAGGTSLSAIQSGIAGSAEAQIQGLYKELFGGRTADAAGLNYWLGTGSSIDTIRAQMMQSEEYKKLHPFAVGTNFIPEDMPALVHRGERIIPAADNRALMARLSSPGENNAALAAELKALREEVQGLRAEARATAGHTEKTSRLLNRVIRDGALVTATEDE